MDFYDMFYFYKAKVELGWICTRPGINGNSANANFLPACAIESENLLFT